MKVYTISQEYLQEPENIHGAGGGKLTGFWGARYTYVLMAFFGTALTFANRVDLAVAIVAMVSNGGRNNATNDSDVDIDGWEGECSAESSVTDEENYGEFDWSEKQQGLVLGGISFGYAFTQFFGGYLSEKYGGKWVFGVCTLASAAIGGFVPLAARLHPMALVVLRVTQGVFQGPTFPAAYAIAVKWMPEEEQARLMSFIFAGPCFGIVLGTPLTGILVKKVSWESIFYIEAGIGVFWFVLFVYLCASSPAEHPRISQEERLYIESNVGSRTENNPPAPLLKILTSRIYWVLQITSIGQYWGFLTLMAVVPKYLSNIQNLSIETNGLVTALPYACNGLMNFPIAYIGDKMANSGRFSKPFMRNFFNSVAFVSPALGLVWICFVGCNTAMAIAALCIGLGLNAAVLCGYFLTYSDVAPNYGATMIGMVNTLSNLGGFISPVIVGAITEGNQTTSRWRIVFLLSAGIYLVCNLIYVAFGTTEVQPWNNINRKKERKESEKKQ